MISFKQYLLEARMAPLYHGTYLLAFQSIIKNNVIRTGFETEEHWPSKTGAIVSLTRNFAFAKEWSEQSTNHNGYIVLELDQQKLTYNYKIVPFNFFASHTGKARLKHDDRYDDFSDNLDMNQYEEAVTKDIKNALSYIKKIHMSKDIYNKLNKSTKDMKKVENLIVVK